MTRLWRKTVGFSFLLALLFGVYTIAAAQDTPDSPEDLLAAANAAFTTWADANGEPFRDLTLEVLENDGYFATVDAKAEFRADRTAPWLLRRFNTECRLVGAAWRCKPPEEIESAHEEVVTADTEAGAQIIKTVLDTPITLAEFTQRYRFDLVALQRQLQMYQQMETQFGIGLFTSQISQSQSLLSNPDALVMRTLDQMTAEIIIAQEAAQRELVVTDEEIDLALREEIATQLGAMETPAAATAPGEITATDEVTATLDDTDYAEGMQALEESLLENAGMTLQDYRRLVAGRLQRERLAEIISQETVEKTEDAVRARHILVRIDDNEDRALKVIRDLRARIVEGEDFAAIAEVYSDDLSNAASGGDLGWFGKGMMVPEFEAAAFALEEKGLSEPIKTDFGYHLIEVLERDDRHPRDEASIQRDIDLVFEDWLAEQLVETAQPEMAMTVTDLVMVMEDYAIVPDVSGGSFGATLEPTDVTPPGIIDDELAHSSVVGAAADQEGNVWFGTAEGVNRVTAEGTLRTYDELRDVISVGRDPYSGRVWFASHQGVGGLAPDSSWTTIMPGPDTYTGTALSVLPLSEYSLLIGTDNGVYIYNWTDWTRLSTDDGLAGNEITAIMHIVKGDTWFATPSGATRLSWEDDFTTFHTEDGLPSDVVLSFAPGKGGSTWIGTDAGPVLLDISGEWITPTPVQDWRMPILAIYPATDGSVWFGTQDGLIRLGADGSVGSATASDGLPGNRVTGFAEDGSGYIWVATDGGVARYVFAQHVSSDPSAMSNDDANPVELSLAQMPNDWISGTALGNPEATVFVQLWSDFLCPACQLFAREVLPELITEYVQPGLVRIEFHHFPLVQHAPGSFNAAYAAECAADQEMFWPIHDRVFEMAVAEGQAGVEVEKLIQAASDLGMDSDLFADCLTSQKYQPSVNGSIAQAQVMGLTYVPSVLVNGELLQQSDFESIKNVLDQLINSGDSAVNPESKP